MRCSTLTLNMFPTENKNTIHFQQRLLPNCTPRPWNCNLEWRGEHKPIPHTAHCCQVCGEVEKNLIQLFYSHTAYFLLIQPLISPLAAFVDVPREGWGTVKWMWGALLTNWLAVSFPSIHMWPGTHTSCILLCSARFTIDWWQYQTNLEFIWKHSKALMAICQKEYRYSHMCSFCLFRPLHKPYWHIFHPWVLWYGVLDCYYAPYWSSINSPQCQCLYWSWTHMCIKPDLL